MKLKSKTKHSGKGKGKLKSTLKQLNKNVSVLVGIPQDSMNYPDGTSTAMVAAVHEFGTATVPERSFMRSTLDQNSEEYQKMLERGTQKVIDGDLTLEEVLGLIGLQAVGDIQQKLVELSTPPLKESTIQRRTNKSSNPLVDTGHLKNSIRHEVRST